MSNRKAEFLGMPYGTAINRLRKQLMFNFAQRLGEDNCFVCGKKIDTPDDLSIEHKEPWLDRENGEEKFWDLDNIAFSHLKCNKPHIHGSVHKRKVGPDGTAWCCSCQDYKPLEEFSNHKSRWNGKHSNCKDCKNEQDRNRKR